VPIGCQNPATAIDLKGRSALSPNHYGLTRL
jgi:hypothetical protein